jgi:hypothetical protein
MVAKIATGEIEEEVDRRSVGKIRSGKAGAKARAENLTADGGREIAKRPRRPGGVKVRSTSEK